MNGGFAGEREDFEAMLLKARKDHGLEKKTEDEWLAWSGLHTRTGMEIAVDHRLNTEDYQAKRIGMFIIAHSTVGKDVIVEVLTEKSDQVARDGDMKKLQSSFFVLSRLDCYPRDVLHFAKFFDDKRILEAGPRHPESDTGNLIRVCDYASGLSADLLEKEGLWVASDPDYYDDPQDSRTWEGRDKTKEAVRRFMIRTGIIKATEQEVSRPPSEGPESSPAAAPGPAAIPPVENGDGAATVKKAATAAGLLILLAAAWLVMRGRRNRRG